MEEYQSIMYSYLVCLTDDVKLNLQPEEVVDAKWFYSSELENMKEDIVDTVWDRYLQFKDKIIELGNNTKSKLDKGCYNMKKPKMIIFDYGQTLVNEKFFDGVKGTEAVLKYASKNKYNKSAEEIQAYANELNKELGRFDPEKRHLFQVEVSNRMFSKYLYESQGIEISLSPEEMDSVFWDAAAPGVATEGVEKFLSFLKANGIRTGVISNISYSGIAVIKRINECLPNNDFEFIIATSEYMYRKPNKHIFELALEKAELSAEDVWYIGDQYQCDIVGAKDSGMQPVWYIGVIDMKYEPREEVLTVKTWEELIDILVKSMT